MTSRRRARACGVALGAGILGLVAVLGPAALAGAVEPGATPAPPPIAVVAPPGSRLADELRRELTAAQLPSLSAAPGDLAPIPYARAVVVASNDGRLIVFSRAAPSSRAEVRLELRFDSADRPARRRACLAVVEELRALDERPARAPVAAAGERDAPASTVDVSPADGAPAAPAAPAPAREVLALAPAALATAAPREPWVMGAATMLDVDRRLGAPMVHLQFTWLTPVGAHLAFRTLVMWPLLGTALRLGASDARIWTFGAAVGLQYVFAEEPARLRPFAGIATGSQLLLTDTPAGGSLSDNARAPFVPSANVRLQSGARFTVASRVQLLGELEATRDWLLPSSRLAAYRNSAANTFALHVSLGVLFEY